MGRSKKQPSEVAGESRGAALLSAVERIVESPERIRTRVDQAFEHVRASLPEDAPPDGIQKLVDKRLISEFSNRTAIAGGASALPALIPGVGSLATLVGGSLVDMTLCLKYEVELVLALAAARGYRIEDPRERQLAYLLAAAETYEASSGQNVLVDLVKTEVDAIWRYTPRQIAKVVGALFVKLALLYAGKSLARAIPFVGVVVSGVANKALTERVGQGVVRALDGRKRAEVAKAAAAVKATPPPRSAPQRKKKVG